MAEVTENKVDEIEENDEPSLKKQKLSTEDEKPSVDEKTSVVADESTEKNGTSESTNADPTGLEKKIIRQIEHYFGDSNLSRDKFLNEQTTKDDGWVPLSVLLTFKRLAALSTDVTVIINALDKSDEGLIEIHEDKLKIRRHPERPLPEQNEETRKECIARSAYVKGFPLDIDMSQLIDFFSPFEKVLNICMRKYLDKPTKQYKFKGSVFVTFAKKEQCEEFLKKEKICHNETELITKWQSEYYESKKLERQNEKQKTKKTDDKHTIDLPKGAVIHLEGLGKDITREVIKETISELGGEVAFIDYNKGDESGHVRFTTENSAKPIVDKLENSKLKIGEIEATARILEGTEETEFLEKAVESMKNRRTRSHKGGRQQNYRNDRKRRGSP